MDKTTEGELRRRHARTSQNRMTGWPKTGKVSRSIGHTAARRSLATRPGVKHRPNVAQKDLDRFKYVNETLGHAAGDQLLREAAQRIRENVSESDTVARLGGDEFTVVLGNYASIIGVEKRAEVILTALTQPFTVLDREAFVSGSIGITLYPDDATEMEQLLRNADSAMYRAKEAGRNNFRYFTSEMNDALRRRLRLEHDLRRAIGRNELEAHFQPIFNNNGRVVGAEALARWNHRELGMIAPDEFIPLADEIGVITSLEHWMMRQAVNMVCQWNQLGVGKLFVSFNISTQQCTNTHCYDFVRELLRTTDIEPSQFKLEITERVMMEELGRLNEKARQ